MQSDLFTFFPYLNENNKYGVMMTDGQMNDTRLCLDSLLTSTIDNYVPDMKGANILNYARFDEFSKDKNGQINGISFTDKLTGETIKVNGKVVINATGVFSDNIRLLDDPSKRPRMVASAGTHITMPHSFTDCGMALLVRTSDGRILFV